MKRIPLIEHFRNMWVIYYNGPCGGARGGDGAKALGHERRRAPEFSAADRAPDRWHFLKNCCKNYINTF
jgi:hypothetical protein